MTNHKRFHANCITSQLINIGRMPKLQASIACDEANRLGLVGKLPLSDIIQRVGPMSAAQYDIKAAQLKNNKPSTEPGNTGVPDKKYPISSMGDDYDSCVKGLLDLNVDRGRAEVECSSQWRGTGNRGGKGWTTPQIATKPNGVVARGEGRRLAVGSIKNASEKINAETKAYYSKKPIRNASVVEREPEIPAYITLSGVEREYMDYMRPTRTTNNIKSARVEDQPWYSTYATQNRIYNEDLERLVQQRGRELNTIAAIKEDRMIKSGAIKKQIDPRPAWLICMED